MHNIYKITILAGDGVGPEITTQALKVLDAVAGLCGFTVQTTQALIGGAAIDATGEPLPETTIKLCKESDAVLLGAVGGEKWDNLPPAKRPEKGLLAIRAELGLFANLRPVIVHSSLLGTSPLKYKILDGGLDLMIVRELTGGIYFGKRGRKDSDGHQSAFDTEEYSEPEIQRIGEVAFRLATQRGKKLCSVDKANVLESSRLWRETITALSAKYKDVTLSHMYVDNAAMQIIRDPHQFDTIVTSNMFGDILSDEASQITGSIGMLPSASLGAGKLGLYEPIHGSAPDIAGKNLANPIATILSVAMMLRHSMEQDAAAVLIEKAVTKVLERGMRTADIAVPGQTPVSTDAMGDAIVKALG